MVLSRRFCRSLAIRELGFCLCDKLVRMRGLEPPRDCSHSVLSAARLPFRHIRSDSIVAPREVKLYYSAPERRVNLGSVAYLVCHGHIHMPFYICDLEETFYSRRALLFPCLRVFVSSCLRVSVSSCLRVFVSPCLGVHQDTKTPRHKTGFRQSSCRSMRYVKSYFAHGI